MAFVKGRLLGFGIENFRIFKNNQWFDLAPITILTGKNNSGKSSLIKAIRLFAKTVKLNNGLYLDFSDSDLKLGSFDEIKNNKNKELDKITFSFRTVIEEDNGSIDDYIFFSDYTQEGIIGFEINVNGENFLVVTGNRDNEGFTLSESFIKLHESVLDIKKLKSRLNLLPDEIFNKIMNEIITFLEKDHRMHVSRDYWYDNFLNQKNHPVFNIRESIYYALNNIGKTRKPGPEISDIFGDDEYHLTQNPLLEEILNQEIKGIVEDSFLKDSISKYINYDNIKFYPVSENLFSNFLNIDILEGVRAEQSVVFKDSDNPKLSEIFRNYGRLPDHNQQDIEMIDLTWHQKNFIDLWLRMFGIMDRGSELQIVRIPAYGYRVYIKNKDGREMHLTEMGYGFTQILPMILKICMSEERIIIIEEPESNLHPALQSQLADFFVMASKDFNIQFIIETHSEYLIRKLQYLTAKTGNNLNPEDTIIYYFYHPDESPNEDEQIKRINIQADGSLTNDFGTGFFDEADKIAMSIWNMNNSQKN